MSFHRLIKAAVLPFVGLALLSGCASQPEVSDFKPAVKQPTRPSTTESASQGQREQILNSFLHVFNRWEGAPYQFGGTTKSGVDCSAFVQIAFRDATQTQLPRTTYSQVQVGKQLGFSQAQPGDLVFFKPSRSSRHVGVYLGNKQFMHASQSKGVIISRLDNPYWASTFWQFRRVLTPPSTH
ncbi:NlpC/P60 family protein [Vibrio olivae]|uniref:NlpC/P60 family protein n=1 Tax=Vibrio olivae TaxID=1243002 RepID=A0ABV5HIS9_9VIBR